MNESSQQAANDGAFYLFYDDKQHGPLSSAQVRGLYLDGAVGDDTPACQAGMAEWQPLKVVLPALAQSSAPKHAQSQNTHSQSQPEISPPLGGWSRKAVVALVSLSLAFVVFGVAGIVWGLRQRVAEPPKAEGKNDSASQSAPPATVRKETKDESDLEYLFRRAEQGGAEAQYELGGSYFLGHDVKQDDVEAVRWYRKAAEQGHAAAQQDLGFHYEFGLGIKQDYTEAVKWYRSAAEQNDASAQYALGNCYYRGLGVNKDALESVKWYRKAAEQNDAPAQYALGMAYQHGIGVAKSSAESVRWHRKAAEQNHAQAQSNLGIAYSRGEGVAKDNVEAYAWFNLATKADKKNADVRDVLSGIMSPQQIATGQQRTTELLAQIEAKRKGKAGGQVNVQPDDAIRQTNTAAMQPPLVTLPSSDHFVLKPNIRYVYEEKFGTQKAELALLSKHIIVKGQTVTYFIEEKDGANGGVIIGAGIIGFGGFFQKEDGIYAIEAFWRRDLRTANLDNAQRFLKLPPRVGNAERVVGDWGSTSVRATGFETVVVPAGTFPAALKLVLRNDAVEKTMWFAKGVGLVKEQIREGTGWQLLTVETLSAQAAKRSDF